jgi:hypothetical protein
MPAPDPYKSPLVRKAGLRVLPGQEGFASLPYAATISTASDGTFTVSLPASMFSAAPVIEAVVLISSARPHVVTLTAVSASSVSGFVLRGRKLPATIAALTDLQDFDPWESPGVVQVCLMAKAAAP